MEEISTPKILVFSYTDIQSGGINLKEKKKKNEMATQYLLPIQIQTHLCHSTVNLSLPPETQVLLVPQT
jgi:hypothetical protein